MLEHGSRVRFGENGFLHSIYSDAQDLFLRAKLVNPELTKSGSEFLGLINRIQGGNDTVEQKLQMLDDAQQALSNPAALDNYQQPARNSNLFEQVAGDLGTYIPLIIDNTTVEVVNNVLDGGKKVGSGLGGFVRGLTIMARQGK